MLRKPYRRLFLELEKNEEFYQNAFDFIKQLNKDPDLRTESLKLYREVEKRFKKFLTQKYKDGTDRNNFSGVMQDSALTELLKKPKTEAPEDMSHAYLTFLFLVCYKLNQTDKEAPKKEGEPQTAATPAGSTPPPAAPAAAAGGQ